MPQFDQFSFFNQVFWFLFIFINIYFLVTNFLLPNFSFDIKFRKKKTILDTYKKNQIYLEKKTIFFFNNYSYQSCCSNLEFFGNQKINIYKKLKIEFLKKKLLNIFLKKNINLFLNNNFIFFKQI